MPKNEQMNSSYSEVNDLVSSFALTEDRETIAVTHAETATGIDKIKKEGFNFRLLSGNESNQLMSLVVSESGAVELKAIHKVSHEYLVDLFGDLFVYSCDSVGSYLRHKQWPLIGEGDTFNEAKADLISNIRHIKSQLAKSKLEDLDRSAVEFRDYLLNFLNI